MDKKKWNYDISTDALICPYCNKAYRSSAIPTRLIKEPEKCPDCGKKLDKPDYSGVL